MHRDLKPANIFIGQDYMLKIGDLGLGRSFSSETLEAYSKVGTPLYMSPELIQDSGYN
jgi:NIMA (never in mitosis gene a)-related kinase